MDVSVQCMSVYIIERGIVLVFFNGGIQVLLIVIVVRVN